MHDFYLFNGLKVIIYEKHTNPLVSVNIVYDIGSHDDPIGKKGLAHVMQNLMWQGSKNYKKDKHQQIISSIGGESESTFWSTGDYLQFYNIAISDSLELLLKLESDRMSSLIINSEAVKKSIDMAQSTLKHEMDNPFWPVDQVIKQNMYPDKHPYSYHWIGNENDINNISTNDCLETYYNYFTPNNAILVIVGNVDPLETLHKITKYFGQIKPSENLPVNPNLLFNIKSNKNIDVFSLKNWPVTSYVELYSIPSLNNKDAEIISFISTLLNMKSSTYTNLYRSNNDFIDGFVLHNQNLGSGVIGFVLETSKKNKNYKTKEKAIKKFINNLKINGIDESYLKTALKKEKLQFYERNYSVKWTAMNIAYYEINTGDYTNYFKLEDFYETITNKTIKEILNKYLVDGYKLGLQTK